jgi:hypothetical protein
MVTGIVAIPLDMTSPELRAALIALRVAHAEVLAVGEARHGDRNWMARITRDQQKVAERDLVRAAVEGRLLRGVGVERLRDAPAEWSQQFEALGLNSR